MNCHTYQTEIEELTVIKALSTEGQKHLEKCADCRAFNRERANLRQMFGSLEQVDAPNDFNFRLRSRLRQHEPQRAALMSGVKTAWLVSSSAAICLALVLTFVLNRETNLVTQPSSESVAQITAQPALTNNAEQPQTPLPSTPEVLQPNQLSTKSVVLPDQAKAVARKNAATKTASPRKVAPKNQPEIYSMDSALDTAKPSIMASGFNDPLAPPKKQTAAGLLRTVGVETENKAEGLFVISINPEGQAGRSDLRMGDVIQKVNGESPLAVSGNEFKEFKLTVRRNNQIQEITISTKP